MQTAHAFLEARSQAQGLDWSLVLISQGIENAVTRREDGAWLIEVASGDLPRATESIRAYERENATVWRREVKWTGLLFDGRSVIWYGLLALFFWFAAQANTDFRGAGVVIRSAVLQGEWWRVFTAVTLHADVAHLAANVTTGIVLLGLAMGCFGGGNALLLSFLGGALGNIISLLLHDDPFRSLGASGMVMASLGLLTAQSLVIARHERRGVLLSRGVVAGCLLVVLLGLSPESDVLAHVGGFAAGVVLGLVAMRFRNLLLGRGVNTGSATCFVALVLAAWWVALNES